MEDKSEKDLTTEDEILKELKRMNRKIGSLHANVQFIMLVVAIPIIIWGFIFFSAAGVMI